MASSRTTDRIRYDGYANLGARGVTVQGWHVCVVGCGASVRVASDNEEGYDGSIKQSLMASTENAEGSHARLRRCTINPRHYSAMFVTIAVFAGYAALVIYQHNLSVVMGLEKIPVTLTLWPDIEQAWTSSTCWQPIFRIAHNFVLAPLLPSQRVYFSLCSMMLSMSILGFGIALGSSAPSRGYLLPTFLAGVCRNLRKNLSVITPSVT